MINGVIVPAGDNRGRAFPFKDSEIQFCGPAVVGGKVWRMSLWLNKSQEGRSYVRAVFEEPMPEDLA